MASLVECFDFKGQQVVSIIGSGGKTSLMWYLANCYRQEKVLVSTTTKIGYPMTPRADFFFTKDFAELPQVGKGITLAGTVVAAGKKLSMPPVEVLQNSLATFDKVFLEADGSKQLPLKGWADFEPVILAETSITIAVLPITVIGEKANGETVHRLLLFLKLTGMEEDEVITEQNLAKVISSPAGLWRKSQGERVLCLSQVETPEQFKQAQKIVSFLSNEFLEKLTKVIASSVKNKRGVIIWEKA